MKTLKFHYENTSAKLELSESLDFIDQVLSYLPTRYNEAIVTYAGSTIDAVAKWYLFHSIRYMHFL